MEGDKITKSQKVSRISSNHALFQYSFVSEKTRSAFIPKAAPFTLSGEG
jgi:hypothetical protein